MSASNAKQTTMVCNNGSTKLWNIAFEVDKVLALLESYDVVKVYIFIAPFEIVDNSFISKLLFDNEYILEELNDPFTDV